MVNKLQTRPWHLTRFSTSSFIDEKACLLAFQNEEEVLWPFAFFPVQKSATNLQALVQQTFIDLSNPALEPLKERRLWHRPLILI